MPESVVRKVGHRIRELRQKKGWSQEKLAEEANLHRTYIGQVERGEKSIGVENLVRLSRALGVAAAALLRGVR
jgi:transcriptional regulator with XRE-family HTH domain